MNRVRFAVPSVTAVATTCALAACSTAHGGEGPINGSWTVLSVAAPGERAVDIRPERVTLDVHDHGARADDGVNVYDSSYRAGAHQSISVSSRSASAVGYPATLTPAQQAANRAVTILMLDGSFHVTVSGDTADVAAGGTTIVLKRR